MGRLSVCVTFAVEEVYDFEGEDTLDNEEEYIELAKEQLMSDFNLSEWQGEWMNTMVDHEDDA